MKRIATVFLFLELVCFLSSCETEEGSSMQEEPPAVFMHITLTAGDTTLQGVLFDNETARAFSDLLPLDAVLWDPAPGFARAFNLQNILPVTAQRTRAYELGGLAYWNSGPSIAIFYNDDRERTVVPVTTIGRLDGDVSLFFDYDQTVHIEKAEDPVEEEMTASPSEDISRLYDSLMVLKKVQ